MNNNNLTQITLKDGAKIFFPPTVPRQIQAELIVNKLFPIFSFMAQRSELLDEIPPLRELAFHYSELSRHASIEYIHVAEVLCNSHFSSYLAINTELTSLDKEISIFKKNPRPDRADLSEEEYEIFLWRHSEKLTWLKNRGDHLEDVRKITDQGFIVQLWSFNEKHLSRMMKIFISQSNIKITIPARWDGYLRVFDNLQIDLSIVPCIMESFNELRVLNNKIKHLGEVDAKLAEFEKFKDCEGMKLEELDFDMQRYLDSSYAFFVFLAQELFTKTREEKLKNKSA